MAEGYKVPDLFTALMEASIRASDTENKMLFDEIINRMQIHQSDIENQRTVQEREESNVRTNTQRDINSQRSYNAKMKQLIMEAIKSAGVGQEQIPSLASKEGAFDPVLFSKQVKEKQEFKERQESAKRVQKIPSAGYQASLLEEERPGVIESNIINTVRNFFPAFTGELNTIDDVKRLLNEPAITSGLDISPEDIENRTPQEIIEDFITTGLGEESLSGGLVSELWPGAISSAKSAISAYENLPATKEFNRLKEQEETPFKIKKKALFFMYDKSWRQKEEGTKWLSFYDFAKTNKIRLSESFYKKAEQFRKFRENYIKNARGNIFGRFDTNEQIEAGLMKNSEYRKLSNELNEIGEKEKKATKLQFEFLKGTTEFGRMFEENWEE